MLRRIVRDSLLFVLVIALCGLAARLILFPRLRAEGMRRSPSVMCHVTAFGRAHFSDLSPAEAEAELERLGVAHVWSVETASPGEAIEPCQGADGPSPYVEASGIGRGWDLYVPVRDGLVLSAKGLQPPSPPITPGIVFIFFGILAGAGALCSLLLRWPDARRIKLLARSARSIRGGSFEQSPIPEARDEVGRLAADFNSMSRLLEAHVLRQDSLIHAIAHEYRTPLATARFGLEMLQSADEPGERNRQAARVERSLDRLESIVGEVLQYAEFAEGSPAAEQETVSIAALATQVRDEETVEHGVEVHVLAADEGTVEGHPLHIRMVIANLLRNAIRHTSGRVELRVASGPDAVEVLLDDDGPGIPEGEREIVFAPFARLGADRSREGGGVGLGLALVQQLARLHGATLAIEDSELGGARVRVAWPRRPAGLSIS